MRRRSPGVAAQIAAVPHARLCLWRLASVAVTVAGGGTGYNRVSRGDLMEKVRTAS
jgi:hypothetical protein